ncbi:hypothetical protein FUSNEC_GEN_287_01605 [Fusobacterium necrophorum subsp. funduliforme]
MTIPTAFTLGECIVNVLNFSLNIGAIKLKLEK